MAKVDTPEAEKRHWLRQRRKALAKLVTGVTLSLLANVAHAITRHADDATGVGQLANVVANDMATPEAIVRSIGVAIFVAMIPPLMLLFIAEDWAGDQDPAENLAERSANWVAVFIGAAAALISAYHIVVVFMIHDAWPMAIAAPFLIEGMTYRGAVKVATAKRHLHDLAEAETKRAEDAAVKQQAADARAKLAATAAEDRGRGVDVTAPTGNRGGNQRPTVAPPSLTRFDVGSEEVSTGSSTRDPLRADVIEMRPAATSSKGDADKGRVIIEARRLNSSTAMTQDEIANRLDVKKRTLTRYLVEGSYADDVAAAEAELSAGGVSHG